MSSGAQTAGAMTALDVWTVLTIVSMAAVTYLLRAGGYWLFRTFKPSPGVQSMLTYVPGALFVSFVVPSVVAGGMKEWIAAGVTVAVAVMTRSIVWPIFAGTATAWVVWVFQ
jgi:uncharacterized membrane protein